MDRAYRPLQVPVALQVAYARSKGLALRRRQARVGEARSLRVDGGARSDNKGTVGCKRRLLLSVRLQRSGGGLLAPAGSAGIRSLMLRHGLVPPPSGHDR